MRRCEVRFLELLILVALHCRSCHERHPISRENGPDSTFHEEIRSIYVCTPYKVVNRNLNRLLGGKGRRSKTSQVDSPLSWLQSVEFSHIHLSYPFRRDTERG